MGDDAMSWEELLIPLSIVVVLLFFLLKSSYYYQLVHNCVLMWPCAPLTHFTRKDCSCSVHAKRKHILPKMSTAACDSAVHFGYNGDFHKTNGRVNQLHKHLDAWNNRPFIQLTGSLGIQLKKSLDLSSSFAVSFSYQ